MNTHKKTIISLCLFFSLFFISQSSVSATCVQKSGDCSAQATAANPSYYTCDVDNAPDQCCVNEAECTAFTGGASTCSGGIAAGSISCIDNDAYTCYPDLTPQMQLAQDCQNGPFTMQCYPGVGCAAPTLAPGVTIVPCGQSFTTTDTTKTCSQLCIPLVSGTTTTCAAPTATPLPPTPIPEVTVQEEEGASPIVNSQFLSRVNPLTITGNTLPSLFGLDLLDQFVGGLNEAQFASPALILNRLLRLFLFPLAGMILFVMIVWGGFEMLYGANDSKAQEAGKQRITAALIGFLLLFSAYWIAQIVQAISGVNILG